MGCRELQYYFSNGVNSDHHRASGSIPNRFVFRFSSEYHDSETNLVYFNYRYYSPELGRWLSRDPIGENGGWNLYVMVGNDVVGEWDYLGLDKLITNILLRCDCGEIKIIKATATFHEDEFTTLWLWNPDYDIDIPGEYEFREDGIYYNYEGNVITAAELVEMALDGGAQSSEEWKKKIKKLANRNAINNGLTQYYDRIKNSNVYKKAKARENHDALLYATVNNLFWGLITGPLEAAGKVAGNAITAADLTRSYVSAMLAGSNTDANIAASCKDQDDLAEKMKASGFYDIKKIGKGAVSGKFVSAKDMWY